jgi:hypothetical protein
VKSFGERRDGDAGEEEEEETMAGEEPDFLALGWRMGDECLDGDARNLLSLLLLLLAAAWDMDAESIPASNNSPSDSALETIPRLEYVEEEDAVVPAVCGRLRWWLWLLRCQPLLFRGNRGTSNIPEMSLALDCWSSPNSL